MTYLLSYLLASVCIFSLDRWLLSGDCPDCKGPCKECALLNSVLMGLLWPAILLGAIWGSRRKK